MGGNFTFYKRWICIKIPFFSCFIYADNNHNDEVVKLAPQAFCQDITVQLEASGNASLQLYFMMIKTIENFLSLN